MNRPFAHAIDELKGHPQRWLVTGAAGFIGSHLCEFLLRHGQEVVGLDNFATGFKSNVEYVRDNAVAGRFEFIEGDIRDSRTCMEVSRGVACVLHQAALGSVPRSLVDPKATDETNVGGFLNMLVAARENQVSRFVYASSSSVYGDNSDLPKVEDRIGEPLSPYAVSKRTNELYAQVFTKNFAMEIIGLRYFNVFGPRQNPEGPYAAVIPKWIDALLAGRNLTIHGDGLNSRDFCYVDNVVQMNTLAALTKNPLALNRVYNTACGARTTLRELSQILLKKFEITSADRIQQGERRSGDIAHSLASIELAQKYLGYEPMFDFARGLGETINWYLSRCL